MVLFGGSSVMPYLLSNGDILQSVVRTSLQAQTCLLVNHYRLAGLAVPTDGPTVLNDLANVLDAPGGFIEKYADVLSVDCQMLALQTQAIWPIRYAKSDYSVTPLTGSVVGTALPVNLAWALTRRNNVAAPGSVGTSHIQGLIAAWVTGGSLNANGAGLRAAFAAVQSPILVGAVARFQPVLFRVSAPAVSLTIDSAVPQTTVRTMHRRTVGLGI